MREIVLIFDDSSVAYLKDRERPVTPLSHDQNLFQFGHAWLERGYSLYYSTTSEFYRRGEIFSLNRVYPTIKLGGLRKTFAELEDPVLFSCHIGVFGWGHLPEAIMVAIHPALYFIEMPNFFSSEQTLSLMLAARHHVDFVTVQNERMKDILVSLYGWLAGWDDSERILVSPMSIVEGQVPDRPTRADARRQLRCTDDEIVIVNGGGIWRWTGFNDFLLGFIGAVRAGAGNLVLYLTGFRQTENEDHGAYIAQTKAILAANADLVGNRFNCDPAVAGKIKIHVEDDWNTASRRIPTLLAGADYGLNVNRDGLENWQAQRVRCLDYAKYGLPLLSTSGDNFSDNVAGDGVVHLHSLDPSSVARRLLDIAGDPALAARAKIGIAAAVERMSQVDAIGMAVDRIIQGGKRSRFRPTETTLEIARRLECDNVRRHVRNRLSQLV